MPVLVIVSEFSAKKVCSWFNVFLARILQDSHKNIFSVRFLQEMYLLSTRGAQHKDTVGKKNMTKTGFDSKPKA